MGSKRYCIFLFPLLLVTKTVGCLLQFLCVLSVASVSNRQESGELALYGLAAVYSGNLLELRHARQSVGTGLHEKPTSLPIPSHIGHLQRDSGHLQHVALLRGKTNCSHEQDFTFLFQFKKNETTK